jgi:hypothetical protein
MQQFDMHRRLAAVERHSVGPRVGLLEPHRDDLIRAIDTLFTGFLTHG